MSELLFEVEGGIGTITINRPERRNALNDAVLEGICDAVEAARKNPEIRLLALRGAGKKAFSSGGDLTGMRLDDTFGPMGAHFARSRYSRTLQALTNAHVPVVGIANGDVLAGGLGLFLACDLTVAVESARLGLPEVHVGLFPMMVMAVLFRNLGRKRAMELLLLGEKISAEQALEWGLLNRVFPAGTFEADTRAFLDRLADRPGMVVRLGKIAYNAIEAIPPATLELLQTSLGNVMMTEDFAEGVQSFLEKRKPSWTHR
ncbi:MAG: crotonase [Deltaproteobacteria bacterium]|nr:MAG: crotonase [Deltaproteobacteria bacterium]